MYALERNAWKYKDRDIRKEKYQLLEYDYLAPDLIGEMFDALKLLELFTGKAWFKKNNMPEAEEGDYIQKGRELLKQNNALVNDLEITATGFENSKRKTIIRKAQQAYNAYTEMILYYGLLHLTQKIEADKTGPVEEIFKSNDYSVRSSNWLNIGGQLMPVAEVDSLKNKIKNKQINSWDELHDAYAEAGEKYAVQKMQHALAFINGN